MGFEYTVAAVVVVPVARDDGTPRFALAPRRLAEEPTMIERYTHSEMDAIRDLGNSLEIWKPRARHSR